jgi:acetyl/propionyl-CoA carboxylase alpha subunit
VTELVVGVDLVELQLRVARGEPLPFSQSDLKQKGHAVQVRLYAEDAANGFLPCVGPVHDFHVHEVGGVLVDSGIESGGEVSMHYDPMVAKVIGWGETREEATDKVVRALGGLSVQGLTTNREFLRALLAHPDYLAGKLHTGFIAEHWPQGFTAPASPERSTLCAVAATLAAQQERRRRDDFLPSIPSGFRNSRFADQYAEYGEGRRVEYRDLGDGRFLVRAGGSEGPWRVLGWEAPCLTLQSPEGLRQRVRVVFAGGKAFVHSRLGDEVLVESPRFPAASDASVKGGFMAPMPGKVIKVNVKPGDAVKSGQVLLVLEAMKMEQATRTPADGVVKQVLVREGDQVTAGQTLVVMDGD